VTGFIVERLSVKTWLKLVPHHLPNMILDNDIQYFLTFNVTDIDTEEIKQICP